LLVIGPLAHLVEHIICNDGVAGSSPVGSTNTVSHNKDFKNTEYRYFLL